MNLSGPLFGLCLLVIHFEDVAYGGVTNGGSEMNFGVNHRARRYGSYYTNVYYSYSGGVGYARYSRVYKTRPNLYPTLYKYMFNWFNTNSYKVYTSKPFQSLSLCENYEADENGTYLGLFTCPLPFVPQDHAYCCGETNAQYCCKFWDVPRNLAGGVLMCMIGAGLALPVVFAAFHAIVRQFQLERKLRLLEMNPVVRLVQRRKTIRPPILDLPEPSDYPGSYYKNSIAIFDDKMHNALAELAKENGIGKENNNGEENGIGESLGNFDVNGDSDVSSNDTEFTDLTKMDNANEAINNNVTRLHKGNKVVPLEIIVSDFDNEPSNAKDNTNIEKPKDSQSTFAFQSSTKNLFVSNLPKTPIKRNKVRSKNRKRGRAVIQSASLSKIQKTDTFQRAATNIVSTPTANHKYISNNDKESRESHILREHEIESSGELVKELQSTNRVNFNYKEF